MDLFENFGEDEEIKTIKKKEEKFSGKRHPNRDLPEHKAKKQRGYDNINLEMIHIL
jgi:hypothetical protein